MGIRLTKGFYVGSLVGGLGLALVLIAVGFAVMMEGAQAGRPNQAGQSIVLLGYLPMLYWVVVFCFLVHKMWAAIQDGNVRTSPGKAVGFLFIPFFNLYWAFQAFPGWATDYNNYLKRHGIDAKPVPHGLFLAFPILVLCAVIPVVGILATLANFVIMIIMVSKIVDGVNALPASAAATT